VQAAKREANVGDREFTFSNPESIFSQFFREHLTMEGAVAMPQPERETEHKSFAAQYMQAARGKVLADDDFHHPPLQRAETFAERSSPYNIRCAEPSTPGY
jgi:hypothetical protein